MRGITRIVLYSESGKRVEFKDRLWTVKLVTLKCGCSRIRVTGYRKGTSKRK